MLSYIYISCYHNLCFLSYAMWCVVICCVLMWSGRWWCDGGPGRCNVTWCHVLPCHVLMWQGMLCHVDNNDAGGTRLWCHNLCNTSLSSPRLFWWGHNIHNKYNTLKIQASRSPHNRMRWSFCHHCRHHHHHHHHHDHHQQHQHHHHHPHQHHQCHRHHHHHHHP